ncbi:hypothetical protein ACOMHN_010182 [Nucella lapillus]
MDATTDLHVSSNGSGAPEISQGLNLVGKLQRFISHKDFLLECLKKNITPRGHGQPKKARVPRGPRNTGKIANRHFRRKNPVKDCSEPAQVINLSTVELSKEQEHLLSRGPKFCPTPASYNERQLLDDSLEGLRRVRLKEYWYDEEVPVLIPTRPKFNKKNYWEPPKGRDNSLDAFCSTVVSRVTAHAPRLPKQRNISRKSQEALQQLRDLVQKRILRISPADKGGAVVVQSFSQYHEEGSCVTQSTTALHRKTPVKISRSSPMNLYTICMDRKKLMISAVNGLQSRRMMSKHQHFTIFPRCTRTTRTHQVAPLYRVSVGPRNVCQSW